jgi:hypothetical protein
MARWDRGRRHRRARAHFARIAMRHGILAFVVFEALRSVKP